MASKEGKLPLPDDFFQVPRLNAKETAYLVHLAKRACKEVVFYSRRTGGPISWVHLSSDDDVEVFQGIDESTNTAETAHEHDPEKKEKKVRARSLTYLRGCTKIYASIDEIADFFRLDTSSKLNGFAQTVGKDLLDQQTLYDLALPTKKNPKHYVGVKWTAVESPSKLARNRDFCYLECHDEFIDTNGKKRGWVRSLHSIKLPCCPPLDKSHGLVRGSLYRSGFIFVESEEKGCVEAIHTLHLDIKGNAPSWLKILVMKRRIKNIAEINKYFQMRRLCASRLLGDLELPTKDGILRCQLCESKFGLFHRKWRCRKCGKVVCTHCGDHFVLDYAGMGPRKVRICTQCSDDATNRIQPHGQFDQSAALIKEAASGQVRRHDSRTSMIVQQCMESKPLYDEETVYSDERCKRRSQYSVEEQEFYLNNEDMNGMADMMEAKRMQQDFENCLKQSSHWEENDANYDGDDEPSKRDQQERLEVEQQPNNQIAEAAEVTEAPTCHRRYPQRDSLDSLRMSTDGWENGYMVTLKSTTPTSMSTTMMASDMQPSQSRRWSDVSSQNGPIRRSDLSISLHESEATPRPRRDRLHSDMTDYRHHPHREISRTHVPSQTPSRLSGRVQSYSVLESKLRRESYEAKAMATDHWHQSNTPTQACHRRYSDIENQIFSHYEDFERRHAAQYGHPVRAPHSADEILLGHQMVMDQTGMDHDKAAYDMALSAMQLYEKENAQSMNVPDELRQRAFNKMLAVYADEIRRHAAGNRQALRPRRRTIDTEPSYLDSRMSSIGGPRQWMEQVPSCPTTIFDRRNRRCASADGNCGYGMPHNLSGPRGARQVAGERSRSTSLGTAVVDSSRPLRSSIMHGVCEDDDEDCDAFSDLISLAHLTRANEINDHDEESLSDDGDDMIPPNQESARHPTDSMVSDRNRSDTQSSVNSGYRVGWATSFCHGRPPLMSPIAKAHDASTTAEFRASFVSIHSSCQDEDLDYFTSTGSPLSRSELERYQASLSELMAEYDQQQPRAHGSLGDIYSYAQPETEPEVSGHCNHQAPAKRAATNEDTKQLQGVLQELYL